MPSSTGELVGMVGSKKDPKRRIQPVKQSSGLKYRRAGGGVQEASGHRARAMFALAVQEDGRGLGKLAVVRKPVIYSSAEKCNRCTSTDQTSLTVCCFRVFC